MRGKEAQAFDMHHTFSIVSTTTVSEHAPDLDADTMHIFLCPSQYALLRGAPPIALQRWFATVKNTTWPHKEDEIVYGTWTITNVCTNFSKDFIQMELACAYRLDDQAYFGRHPCPPALLHAPRNTESRVCDIHSVFCTVCNHTRLACPCHALYLVGENALRCYYCKK
jgi:hypothetical protein